MNSDERLFSQVATHLAGRSVKVRLQQPTAAHALGQAYKSLAGEAIIDIEPNITSDDTFLSVLLHEAAHIKADFSWMQRTNEHQRKPGTVDRTMRARDTWRASAPEKAANDQAQTWLDYANKNYWNYERPGYSKLGQKLLSLMNYGGK